MKQQIIMAGIILCLLTALFAKTDYSDNTVIVVLTPEASNLTETLPHSFFKGIELKQVENISLIHNEKAIEAIKARGSQYQAIYKLTLTTNDKTKVQEAIQLLSKIPGIESASPDYHLTYDLVPNDSEYIYQWGLNGMHGIKAPQAWDITTGSQNVRVGVIDSGIAEHPDLLANLTTGWDFEDDNAITTDDNSSHGTHISGIIGAVADNEEGVAGVNWNVTLVPLQVSNFDHNPTNSDIVAAINYATNRWGTDQQISVLNHSISGYGTDPNDPRLAAINNFPGLFVWSAGNGGVDQIGDDVDIATPYIAHFNFSNIIAVGAIESVGVICQFSNYSSSGDFVHVFAPGGSILSTARLFSFGQGWYFDYIPFSGTSMSAPHVSGVAALLLSINPALTAEQLKYIIMEGADPLTITTLNGQQLEVNRLNAHQAIQFAINVSNIAVSPPSHSFGTIVVNQTSPSQDFTLAIIGNNPYTISSIAITGANASDFHIGIAGLPWHLNAGQIGVFSVSFTPTSSGVKTAEIKIYSDANELLGKISLTGAGWVQYADAPYTQDFEQSINLADLNWTGDLHSSSKIYGNSGVASSNGLALGVSDTFPTQSVYTPIFNGITSQTVLSFAYRLNLWLNETGISADDYYLHPNRDRVYIEASTTGLDGEYGVIHEIKSTNHTPATWSAPFNLLEIPLAIFSDEAVNIRFRVETLNPYIAWFFCLDEVAIHDFPAPVGIEVSQSVNNVTLSWEPPRYPENLIYYTLYRGAAPLAYLPTTSLVYTDEDVDHGQYLYSVRAVYNAGVSNRNCIRVDVPNLRSVPYTQDFEGGFNLESIGWSKSFQDPHPIIMAQSGVNNSNGLVFQSDIILGGSTIELANVYTPTLVGITPDATLTFDYKIVNIPSYWGEELTPATLSSTDKMYIDAYSSGPWGWETMYEINQSNHTPSTEFTTLTIPLARYAAHNLRVYFHMSDQTSSINFHDPIWSFVLDNVIISGNIVQGPPRNLRAIPSNNSVSLLWQAPASAIPLGYKVYRDGVAITSIVNVLAYQDDTVASGIEYTYYVTAVYPQSMEVPSEIVAVQLLSDSDEVVVPMVTSLVGNYPNPFNPETVIRFTLAHAEVVAVDVYNIRGQKVRSLAGGMYEAGVHNVVWNGRDDDGRSVGSGVYFYRMVAGEYRGVRKMVLMK